MKKRLASLAAAVGLAVLLAACGSSGSTDVAEATTTTGAAVATTAVSASPAKVSANTASAAEIAAAIESVGVTNADRWAREVLEYRPYDTSDLDLTHLREELAKYNPAAGVVDLIVSVLEP